MWHVDDFQRVAPEPAPALPKAGSGEAGQGGSSGSLGEAGGGLPSPSFGGLSASPLRETARALKFAADTGKAALIDGPRWYIVGQGFDGQQAASSSAPATGSTAKLKGVFYHEQGLRKTARTTPPPGARGSRRQQVPSGDFRQCLGLLVAKEDNARDIANKLYPRFEGDWEKLPALLELLEDKWGFPSRVFPLLWTQLRRTGGSDPERHIDMQAWVEAFVRWLQVLWVRSSQTKVSRQCFVQTTSNRDLAKVYFMGALLGEGSYGQVHLALHTGIGVARVVKSVPKSQLGMAAEQVEDEVAALKAMDHPHIVRIFEAFETNDALHIVMDYAEGGDLACVIREQREQQPPGVLPQAYSRIAAGQILSALAYMHSKGVIHCDLKPQNVMLLRKCSPADFAAGKDEPHLLLVDFGLSELFEESPNIAKTKTVKGTPTYLAPEGFDGRLSHKSDAWSFGVLLFELLSGQRPFRGTNNVFMLFCQIMREKPALTELPLDARELVGALLTKDPKDRLSAEQCLQHTWFQSFFSDDRDSQEPAQALLPAALGCASYFYRTAMFCAASALGLKDVQALFQAFQAIDTDKSGYLTRQQLTSGLARFGISKDPVAVMASLDLDQDGIISLTEFLAGSVRLEKEVSEPLLRHAFSTFDTDGDGFISRPDLQDVLTGDGPSADMLPDGQTIDQVLEEVSCGEGQISFESFRAYLKRAAACSDAVQKAPKRTTAAVSVKSAVEEMVEKLEMQPTIMSEEGSTAPPEEPFMEFPSFDRWLEELFRNTQRGAALGRVLVFEDAKLEGSYAGQNFRNTCRRIALLACGLLFYSVWALTTENAGWWPRWAPSLRRWEEPVHAANNSAWLFLTVLSVFVLLRCSAVLRWKGLSDSQAAQAIRFERFLCVMGCFLPWVCCCFANRTRVSAIFGMQVTDAFESVNSDYDLIVTFAGTIMFITTLTHVRLVSVLPITMSCVLSYTISSILLDVELASRADGVENWFWPSLLLSIVLCFNLWGHRTVEKHRRLTFLSLHASYMVLREAQEDGGGGSTPKRMPSGTSFGVEAEAETRYSRFKRALEMVRRLADSMDAHKPLCAALHSLLEVLGSLREDIAHVDSQHSVDIGALLQRHGLVAGERELLLAMFDALPASETGADRNEADLLGVTAGRLSILLDGADMPAGPWGWDLLSGRPENSWALASAGEDLVLPTVAAAATAGWCCGPNQAAAARSRAGVFMDYLSRTYSHCHGGEVRAALALRSAHWLAQRLGLWGRLEPWERVALLTAAAGLYSGREGEEQRGCALLSGHPLLAHAASLDTTLKALDASGLAELAAGTHEQPVLLRRLVSQLLARVRPQFTLDDAYRVRVQLECDDKFPVTAADRALLSSLVLSAADLSFLALPAASHEPWALLCQEEARWVLALRRDLRPCVQGDRLDVGLLLQGLIEVLALPLYDTLARVGEAGPQLAVPLRNLRGNLRHWKAAELTALPASTPSTSAGASPATSGHRWGNSGWPGSLPAQMEAPLAPMLGREVSGQSQIGVRISEISDIQDPFAPDAATLRAAREIAVSPRLLRAVSDQVPLPGVLPGEASPVVSPRPPATPEDAPMSPLSRTLRFFSDEVRPAPSMPKVAEEPLETSRSSMSVELPALPGDSHGMAVTASEDFLGRSLTAGALTAGTMMLVLVTETDSTAQPNSARSRPDPPPVRPSSARGDRAWARPREKLGGSFHIPRPRPTPLAQPPAWADSGEDSRAQPEVCSPEPLVAWAPMDEAPNLGDVEQNCPTMPPSPTFAAGAPLKEQGISLPPLPLERTHTNSVSLQSLLENVLSDR